MRKLYSHRVMHLWAPLWLATSVTFGAGGACFLFARYHAGRPLSTVGVFLFVLTIGTAYLSHHAWSWGEEYDAKMSPDMALPNGVLLTEKST